MGFSLSSGFRAAISRSCFLAFLIEGCFFVRSGIPFLRPDPQYRKKPTRAGSCQGWPSHQPSHALCPLPGHTLTALSTAAHSMRVPAITLCYEVGYDAFWLARFLKACRIECLVIDPGSVQVNRRGRPVKTGQFSHRGKQRPRDRTGWLGREDSNLGMAGVISDDDAAANTTIRSSIASSTEASSTPLKTRTVRGLENP
jgi:hypothetical protein